MREKLFAATAMVHALPEADVKLTVPTERHFDLSAFSRSTWPRTRAAGTPPSRACTFWTLASGLCMDPDWGDLGIVAPCSWSHPSVQGEEAGLGKHRSLPGATLR